MEKIKKVKHIPERSCSICSAKSVKQDLIRIVKDPENFLVIDKSKKLPGRGIYICPDLECINKAKKSNSLANILKAAVKDENFWDELEDFAKNFEKNKSLKLRSILGLAKKAGVLLTGSEKIEKFIQQKGQSKILVLLAEDCSEGVNNFLSKHENFVNIRLEMNIKELSEITGSRGGVQILGLPLNSGFAKKIMSLNIMKGD